MSFPAVEEQLALIRRGVEKIVPEVELASKLETSRKTGKPLRIKYGIDPTGIDVHLGHTVPLRKLRQFQDLGHQAVIIIGNYTALVGDPSGRDHARAKRLTAEEVEANARDYLNQVGKVIDLSRAEVHRNGDWFASMSFADILQLCGKVTVAQLLTRDDFAKRYAGDSPIYLHECLYPIMQAWDSVVIKSDVELGGTEQLYSFMLARDLQRDQGLSQQIGVMSPILVGLDGVRRMGKSLGNYIGISESPFEMIKKFMQVPDQVMGMYFELLTRIDLSEANSLMTANPKEAKLRLGQLVIADYYGTEAATAAVDRWQNEIRDKALPTDVPVVTLPRSKSDTLKLVELVYNEFRLTETSSEARRLIAQGGVWISDRDNRITDVNAIITVTDGMVLGAGKKKIVRISLID